MKNKLHVIKSKRGDSELLMREIGFLIFVVIIAAILIAFIYIQSKGDAMKEQNLVKQIALLIDSSEPGIMLTINIEKMSLVKIDSEKKEIFVKASERSLGKKYPYFNNNKIESVTRGEMLIVFITKNEVK